MTSHLNVETLALQEFELHNYPRITLINCDLTWDLSTTVYENQDNIMLDYEGELVCPNNIGGAINSDQLCVYVNMCQRYRYLIG